MKRILLFLSLMIPVFVFSQSTVPIRGDTIRVYKQGGKATLKVDSGTITKGLRLQRDTVTKFSIIDTTSLVYNVADSSFYEWRNGYFRRAGGGGSTVTASNAITKVGNDVQLGGTLIQFTGIELDGNDILFEDTDGSGSFGVDIRKPGATVNFLSIDSGQIQLNYSLTGVADKQIALTYAGIHLNSGDREIAFISLDSVRSTSRISYNGNIHGTFGPYSLATIAYGDSAWGGAGGGTPGGNDGEIQYNNGGAFGGMTKGFYNDANHRTGFGTVTPSSIVDLVTLALGVTQNDSTGLSLGNTTDAAAGAQQISPALRWHSEGWKTQATAASQITEWRAYNLPVEGVANPTSSLIFQSSINDAAYVDKLILNSDGASIRVLSAGPRILTSAGSTGGISLNGSAPVSNNILVTAGFILVANQTWTSGTGITVQNTTHTGTTGTSTGLLITNAHTVSSGTAVFNSTQIGGTINQTVATSVTRGLLIDQTLTAAADYRAFEVARGRSIFLGRIEGNQGADVASTANLVLGADGNTFEITGTTQVNLISNLAWQNGSQIRLVFTSTPTIKHAQSTSGTNITVLLAGDVDFLAVTDDILVLELSEVGGTQAWREVSRARTNITTASNGLTKVGSDVQFGGTLINDRTINTAGFATDWTGSNALSQFNITNTGAGAALTISANSGQGINVTSTTNAAISSTASNNNAFFGQSTGSETAYFLRNAASSGSVLRVAFLQRDNSGGAGANGIGASLQYGAETSTTAGQFVGEISALWVNATHASRTSHIDINAVNNTTNERYMNIQPGGIVRVNNDADTLATRAYARTAGGGGGGADDWGTQVVETDATLTGDGTSGSPLSVVSGGGQSALQFQDEGSNLGTSGSATELDFVGAGVTATRASNKVTVTISGSGGGSGDFLHYYSTTSTTTVASTGSETSILGSGAGTLTVLAADITAGGEIIMEGSGTVGADPTTPGQVQYRFDIGGVAIDIPTFTGLAGVAGMRYMYRVVVTPRTIGASATCEYFGWVWIENNGTPLQNFASGTVGSIATNGNMVGAATVDWNTSNVNNSVASISNKLYVVKP